MYYKLIFKSLRVAWVIHFNKNCGLCSLQKKERKILIKFNIRPFLNNSGLIKPTSKQDIIF